MAEAEVSLSSDQVQRLLQCAVCLDKFNRPKLLPCQHTFCLSPCLEGLIDHRTRSIRCPECRADHIVPRGGPMNFPNNLTIIGFLALSENSASRPSAAEDTDTSRQVNNERNNNNDEAINGVELQERDVNPPRLQRPPVAARAGRADSGCSICHNDRMILRCCHCDCLVCDDCHQEHMQQVRAELARLIGMVRRGLPHVTDLITTIGRKGAQLQNRCETVKTEITEAVEKQVRDLRERERSLHEDVDTFFTREIRGLRNAQENAEVDGASMSSFCDSAESQLGGRRQVPNGDIVEMKRQCEEHTESLRAYEDGTNRSPNVRQIQVSLESPFMCSAINDFGELIITSGLNHAARQSSISGANVSQQTSRSHASVPPSVRLTAPSRSGLGRPMRASTALPASDDSTERDGDAYFERLAHGSLAIPDSRSTSTSPIVPRRQSSNQNHTVSGQVEGETSRWDELSQRMRSNRRSRRDRLSDTRITEESRGPTLSQQMRDRTRHLSLGAFTTEEEPEEEGETSWGENADILSAMSAPRRIDRISEGRTLSVSRSYPGADYSTGIDNRASTQENNLHDEELELEEAWSSLPTHVGSHMPSMYVNTPRNRYNQKGSAIMRIGQRGSEAGHFIWPRGTAASPLDDYIYVCDSSNHRVQVFDNNGRFYKSFGCYGQNEGEFDCLAGITINGLGQVIIADRYNHRIQIFDRRGNFQKLFGSEGSGQGELNYPWGVACDSMGFVYVCDKENHRVQVFQSNGTFVRSFGGYGNRSGQFENPHYVAVSPDNKVYVSDSSNHRIQVFSIYGDFLFSFGGAGTLRGQMKFPRGIAIDNQGFALIADSGNNRIQVFRADGRFYSMFGGWGSENGQFKGLEGLTIQANGRVIVSDRENHRIQIF